MQNSKIKMQNDLPCSHESEANNSKFKKGIYFALATALISGASVFINGFASKTFSDPYLFTTVKNVIVAALLTSTAIGLIARTRIKKLTVKEWLILILIGLIGGSIPFLLFFKGLSLTSSSMAAFIHKTLFIWAMIIAIFWLREKLTWHYLIGLTAMVLGIVILSPLKNIEFGGGEFLVLIATLFWSLEAVIVRRIARSSFFNLSPIVLSWGRMFFGSVFMVIFLTWTNRLTGIIELSSTNWRWIEITSIFLAGYVVFWYYSLSRLPIIVASSMLALGFPMTVLLNALFVTHKFSANLIAGFIISITAAWFLIRISQKVKISIDKTSLAQT